MAEIPTDVLDAAEDAANLWRRAHRGGDGMSRSRIHLTLTEAEARAVLAAFEQLAAGDLYEAMGGDARRVAALERAARKGRGAVEGDVP